MIKIEEVTASQLSKQSFFEELLAEAEEIILYSQTKQAKTYSQILEERLNEAEKRLKPETIEGYRKIISKLKFIALPLLSEQKIVTLFRDHLMEGLETDIDPFERLKFKFISMPFADRDGFKVQLWEAMEQNQQKASQEWFIQPDGRKEPPSVANWLRDLRGFTEGNMIDRLRLAQFFVKNKRFFQLSPAEQNNLKRIFYLYRILHFPSESIEGFEESLIVRDESGDDKIFEDGVFTSVGRFVGKTGKVRDALKRREEKPVEPVTSVDPLALLRQKYQAYRQARRGVLEAEDAILVRTQGQPEAVKRELAASARRGDKTGVIACLKIIARQGALNNALQENLAWFEAVREYAIKKYSPQYKTIEVGQAVSNLKYEATTPAAVSEFLQYLLKDKLRLNENDSALIGVELSQMLGGQFQSLAYGNAETGSFEWTKNRIVGGKLVSES